MQQLTNNNNLEETVCRILRQYPVSKAALFGSVARGHVTPSSDVDILVEFLPGTKGIEFFGLKTDLEEALSRNVDILTFRSLLKAEESFRISVEKEAQVIYESS